MQAQPQLNKEENKENVIVKELDVFTVDDVSKSVQTKHSFFKIIKDLFQKDNIEETIFFKNTYNHNLEKVKAEINNSPLDDNLYKKFIKQKINGLIMLFLSMALFIIGDVIWAFNIDELFLSFVLHYSNLYPASINIFREEINTGLNISFKSFPITLMIAAYFTAIRNILIIKRKFSNFILDEKITYLESLEDNKE